MKLPTSVLYEPDLSDGEKITYAVLLNYQWANGDAPFEMTTSQLATLLGKSADQATRRTQALEEAGRLTVTRRRGMNRPNVYFVHEGNPHGRGSRARTDAAPGSGTDAASGTRIFAGSSSKTEETPNLCADCEYGWITITAGPETGKAARCPTCHPSAF